MTSKTFVLGAGFSVAGKFPLVRNLRTEVLEFARTTTDPLLRTLIDPRPPEYPRGQLLEEIEAVDPRGLMGFEEILLALRRVNRGEATGAVPHLLRNASSKLLWAKQGAIVTLQNSYRNFGSWLKESHGTGQRNAVLSLNWELLAERALQEMCVPWGYSKHCAVPVIKPHGSINWSKHPEARLAATYNEWQPTGPGSPYSYLPDPPRGPFSDMSADGVNADLTYMVFPGDPEDEDGVTQIWGEAEQIVSERDMVVFIGYSLPAYDAFAREFFQRVTKGKIVEVYTDSAQVLDDYRNILSPQNILTIEPITFENCPYAVSPFEP